MRHNASKIATNKTMPAVIWKEIGVIKEDRRENIQGTYDA